VGNVVGSNIFNILWILGVTAGIKELPFDAISNIGIIMVIGPTMLILLAIVASRTATISRSFGFFFCLYLHRLSGICGAARLGGAPVPSAQNQQHQVDSLL
jgi:Ca2+/Na+ antiporter